uniref:Uncharacterized protein n=1 Tax=Oreochromis aureus TaxID=47969 RepID=A0AAZ1XB35_OREAU
MHHDFLEKAESLIEQNSSIAAELSQIESERNEQKKENTDLKWEKQNSQMHRDFQEKEEYLLKENSSIAAEINKLKAENTNLKKHLENLEYQEKTAESLTKKIFWLEEKVKKQNLKIVHNQDLIDELYEHLKMKREIINNLKDELRREEEEKILAAVHKITGEPLQLENLAPEPEEVVSPVSEPSPDVVPTQDNLGPQPKELDSPMAAPS